jgi:uncharacterized membrane protein YagU involved in acid resistance
VLTLILAFVEIALHRRGPEHLPPSRFLFALVLATYLVVALLTTRVLNDPVYPMPAVLIQLVLELAFIWCVLRAFERQRRFVQAACAGFGTDTLLNLTGLPLIAWHRALAAPPTDVTIPQVLQFLLWVWSIDIAAAIMSRALERPYVVALAIVVGYEMLSVSLHFTLFPPAT